MTDSALPSDASIRFPASKRTSSSANARLGTISESSLAPAPPIPPKSVRRRRASSLSLPGIAAAPRGRQPSRSFSTSATAPPPYRWIPEGFVVDDESLHSGPVEGEKLAALRKNGGYKRERRGGWWRLALISAVVALLVLGLAVGLGVGLTLGRHKAASSNDDQTPPTQPSGSTTGALPFPLGEYSMITALKDVATDCTSNPATWSCFPYVVYDATDPTSDTKSMGTFNWALTNTSSNYATIRTGSTPDDGVPANISISSTTDLFSITFSDRPLTFVSPSSNSSSARYLFDFVMEKSVYPSSDITGENMAAECFFNQTTFTATLFLSASRDYPNGNDSTSSSSGGYVQWPYAVQVTQSSGGGQSIPACYEYMDGAVGSAITTALAPQSTDSQCLCGYRNF